MTFPVDLRIAIPARDEQERIGACLGSVLAAVRRARADGLLASVRLGVSAHRCTDATAAYAAACLRSGAGTIDVVPDVVADATSTTIGEVRRSLVSRLCADAASPARTWVLNTDADSTVPTDWVTAILGLAATTGAAAVAGLVEVTGWHGSPRSRLAYRRLVAEGLRPNGHDHAYGANLAVRLDAYRAVGGFAPVPHGEDRSLVDALRRQLWPVLTAARPVVRTSSRRPGRAAHGLGARLLQLEQQPAG